MRVKGTIIKVVISIKLPSELTMDDVDFSCKFYVYINNVQTIDKKDMKRVDENNYIAYVDTGVIGNGEIMIETTAYLPDQDYEGGIRKEIDRMNTEIKTI